MRRNGSWLQIANITLNSGRRSTFKIECDNITDAELEAMCALLAQIIPPFSRVSGVPTGGVRVEKAMRRHLSETGPILIVDDLWTTGGSIQRHLTAIDPREYLVAVLFARGETPPGVVALFKMNRLAWNL